MAMSQQDRRPSSRSRRRALRAERRKARWRQRLDLAAFVLALLGLASLGMVLRLHE
jgi:hypothetical protein